MGSKKEMFSWGKSKSPAPAEGAGAASRAAGEVAVQKVEKIDQVLSLVPRPRPPVFGGVCTLWDGGRAAKGDDIDRQAQEFINRQRSMW
uniref:Uncharacterized protein n=1 Tax=Setaria italica TaxID=4555 RepID=K3ZB87_SETIT